MRKASKAKEDLTPLQVVNRFKKLFPDHAVCATIEVWSYSSGMKTANKKVSILAPGINGKCKIFTAKTFNSIMLEVEV